MNASRRLLPVPAVVALLLGIGPALAACGGGGAGDDALSGLPFYVASFRPGGDSPDEQKYVLTSESGPRIRIVQVAPGPGTSTPPRQTLPATPPAGGSGAPGPAMAWVDDGRYLAVITYGSGSCPDVPRSIDVAGEQDIEIRLGPRFPNADVCTADLGPYVTVVELPRGVTPAKPLTARLGKRQVTLPAATA